MSIAVEPEATRLSVAVGGREIIFETGVVAKQAHGAVLVKQEGTVVLATAVGRTEGRPGADFFPLTVDVEEKMYAAGKIPGGFFKREGRSGEKAILTARMVDRPIRPLWPKGYKNEVQVIITTLSADQVHGHDILGMNGASAALMLSPLPFMGPVGAVRVGRIDGQLLLNPTLVELQDSTLDLVVCGTPEAITMVEAGAEEIDEDTLVEALELAHGAIKQICQLQIELASKAGMPKWSDGAVTEQLRSSRSGDLAAAIQAGGLAALQPKADAVFRDEAPEISGSSSEADMLQRVRTQFAIEQLVGEARDAAVYPKMKQQFADQVRALSDAEQDSKELKSAKRAALLEQVEAEIDLGFPSRGEADEHGHAPLDSLAKTAVGSALDKLYKEVVRTKIAVDKRRPDGRSETEIRPIWSEVSVMPRTHGSALFTRGQTQALTLCTLGTGKEEQRIDDLSLDQTKRYIHHYNFPPFSVGETGFMRGPKRRDIGHGALAERALLPVIPSTDDFPYTLRLVSEILESNGSSSMASVCGSTLSLMDAGVPIKAPVAGIAMGLIKEGDAYVILTDIQGAEDHLGDMDFKVAGTEAGVTALQMDIKITGVTTEILRNALSQAKDARLFILDAMREAIAAPREDVAAHAPRIVSTKIHPDYIGMVIGKGGETIRSLEAEYEVQIDIEEDGTIRIYGTNGELAEGARREIDAMTKDIEVGDTYDDAEVVKLADFGAFISLRKGVDGLLHVSRILPKGSRLASAEQVLARGDKVRVTVVEVDKDRGRIGLTLVAKKNDDGTEITPEQLIAVAEANPAPERSESDRPRGGGGGRDRGRGPRRDR
ncbi:MAG TPA: polyribonucleotide nucleotidyltransferase [Gaiellales bacterium]|jgi:polyribonucleotide nucleotidyltransferase|nr:polyribonucleotide nucleotidyltransferase [Gaiellales bacterium]